MSNSGSYVNDERRGQQPPENRVKPVEPLKAVGGKWISGAENTNKTEKAFTGGKHNYSK